MTTKTATNRACAAAALWTLLAAPAAADHIHTARVALTNRLPSTAERVGITVSGFSEGCRVDFAAPAVSGKTVRLDGATIVTIAPCTPGEWSQSFTLQPLPVGGYTVEVWIDGTLHLQDSFAVQPASSALSFHDGAFAAEATWKNPYGPGEGVGGTIQLGDDSGAFWFFDPGNVEVTIKILDGKAVNGHFWVFLASMTNVEFEITVTKCPTNPLIGAPCIVKTYRNPPFTNKNFLDTKAF
jgi:hypothetical protein